MTTTTRRTLAALAVALATACFTAEAQAADSMSFGDRGPTATFGADDIVRIDGSITYDNHCAKPGFDDFFYPATDVYIVPAGSESGKLHDASGGNPNTIVSGASLFSDEVIAMTAPAGNLDEGDYDIVYDTCQDGSYDPGVDTVFPHAVTVKLPEVLPLADGAVKSIKEEARHEYLGWLATRLAMNGLFRLADQALKAECDAGNPIGCALKQVDYFGGIKERFLQLLLSESNHYLAIAEDPPDTHFDVPTTVIPGDIPRDHSDSPFGNALSDALRPLAEEAALSGALLHAAERYQGAQAAGDGDWALIHAREARSLASTLRAILPASSDALAGLRSAIAGASLDPAIDEGRTFARRVWSSGFTGGERRGLRNAGMSAAQIASLETEVRDNSGDGGLAGSATLLSDLDDLRSDHTATATALDAAVAKWDDIVHTLEAKPGRPPAVDAGGPYTVAAGDTLTLAASGAWDTDGDGEFDDAPSATFAHAGVHVIGHKLGDGIAYAIVDVTDADRAPVLTAPAPADREAKATLGDTLPLSVAASDPDGDPLAYAWTVDGADADDGDGAFGYAAASVGSHTVEVTVSDGHGATTRRAWDVMVLDRDGDGDGWTKTTDCDDTDPAVHPTALERIGNGVDDDCDAGTPDAPPGGLTGSMMSWGANQNATVGTGSFLPTLVSAPVPVPGLDDVVQVEQGDRAGYALLDTGEVRDWGSNVEGQLGLGTVGSPVAAIGSPLPVGGGQGRLSGVTQLASESDGHVLARRSDGTVVAWGANTAFQVGDGSTVNVRTYPAQVVTGPDGAPLTGVRSVEAGEFDSYAIMDDGTLRGWGQIRCDGGTQIRQEHYPVKLPLAGGDIREVSSADYYTLILKQDGTVLECGAYEPAAGRHVTADDVYVPKPVTGFGPGSGVIDVSAGFEGGLALKQDGTVWAWGSNANWELGVLGYNGPASVYAPTQVPLPPGPPVVDVEMDGACAGHALRADGSVLGWGCDFFEQVGNGDGPGSGVTTPTVISLPGRSAFALADGEWNSLALTRPRADASWAPPATWVHASVADATVDESAGGKFKITLSNALPYDVAVDWSAEAGTAGADDADLGSHTATVPAGATSVMVDAPVRDDALDEDDEAFTVVLHGASHGVQLDRSQATVTIADDDAPPAVSVRPASVAEGDTSLTDASVDVRLSAPSGKPVSVAYATADGSAASPADYSAVAGTLVIAPGDVAGTVHVPVRGDTAVEPDEALSVALSDPANATLGEASANLTIRDDEPLALSVASPTVTEGDSGTTPATFTVALADAPPPGSSVAVDYRLAGVTAAVPDDVEPASGTLTFAAGETQKHVTVQVRGDTVVEGDEAFRLVLSDVVGDRVVLRGASPVATIVDDDAAAPPPAADTTPPVTAATGVPDGWTRQSVTVTLSATDTGGSGVKQIDYTVGGVHKTVAGATAAIPVSAEGATTIAFAATDDAGNAEAQKTVVVRIDKTAPTVTCKAGPGTLWPVDHRLVPITVTVKVADARSGPAGFTLTSVTGGPASDIQGFDPGTADTAGQLRAENGGARNGRVYTLTYAGRDAAGNQRTCTTTVTVPHTCTGSKAARAALDVAEARRRRAH